MKNTIKIFLLLAVVAQFSCVKDPFKEFEEDDWNNERSILNIKFEHQIGLSDIVRNDENSGTITVGINVDSVPDFSSIKLSSLVLSYDADATIKIGQTLNFENPTSSASIMVTSPTGKFREYTVIAEPFSETIVGTYEVSSLQIWGGTGPEWGGGAVLALTDKPWIWPENNGPAAEMDNTITMELVGYTDEGNSFGIIKNDAGADGTYADFLYVQDPVTDVNGFYRKLPAGVGQWERNYITGMVTFIFPDGTVTSGVFIESPITIDVGYDHFKAIENQSIQFELNGTDDWDNFGSDYDKFVRRPRTFWIDLKRL